MADDDKDWEDVPPKKAGGAATAVADEWEDVPAAKTETTFPISSSVTAKTLPGSTPRLREAVESGVAPMQPPTRFEKERPGEGISLKGSGGAIWDAIKGAPVAALHSLDPTYEFRHPEENIGLRSGEEAKAGYERGGTGQAVLSALSPLVGLSSKQQAEEAERGEGGKIIGEAAVPLAQLALGETAGHIVPKIPVTRGGFSDRFLTPAVAPGLSEEATANLQQPIARRGIEKVLRATGMPSGQTGLRESFSVAAPDLAEIERAQPLAKAEKAGGIANPDFRVRQTVENIDNHLDKLWNEQRKPQIMRNAELPTLTREELFGDATPEQIKKIEKAFKTEIPEQINLRDADDFLKKVNARLRRAEGMTPSDKALALELSPDLEKYNEMKGTLHEKIGGLLDRMDEPGVKEFNRRYGALSEVRDALQNRMNPVEAERVLDAVRATGGLGRNVNLFERLHLKASPGRLTQKGLEALAQSNLQTPAVPPPRPPLAGLLPPIPEELGNGPDTSGRTNLPVPEAHTVVPVPGGRFVRGLLPGPIAPEPVVPTPPPPVPANFRLEPIGAPTEPGRVGMRGEQGTRVPQKGLLPEVAASVPPGKLPFNGPLSMEPKPLAEIPQAAPAEPPAQFGIKPLENAKPIMEVPKEPEPEEVKIKGLTAEEKAPKKAKAMPVEKRFTSEEIADAEGLLRQEAEGLQQGGKAGRQFVEDAREESTTAAGRNVKKGERMGGHWMTVGGGRDLFPFLRENPKVNPVDILKALRNKDSAAYRNLMEKAVEFNRKNAPPANEAYDFIRGLGANPDAELEGIQEDVGGAEPTFNPEEIEQAPAKPKALDFSQLAKGSKGILPGMEEHVAKQNEGAAKVAGENLTAEANKPKDISAAAGRMETLSPLFRGTEASPQREIFGGAAQNAPPAAIQQAIEGTDWKFEGKNDLGMYTIQEPGTKVRISLFERELHPEFIKRKMMAKEKQFGAPEK